MCRDLTESTFFQKNGLRFHTRRASDVVVAVIGILATAHACFEQGQSGRYDDRCGPFKATNVGSAFVFFGLQRLFAMAKLVCKRNQPSRLALRFRCHRKWPRAFQSQTGLFWPVLKSPKLYMCPMDSTNSPLFAQRQQQCSSYVMNGAANGYKRRLFPCVKLGSMAPDAVAFWEADEMYPHYFNDGASYPTEGVSGRHLQGAINGAFGGSVSYIRFDTWYDEAARTDKNQHHRCFPDSLDGR